MFSPYKLDNRCWEAPDGRSGTPPSLMDDVRAIIMGSENLDMSQREFLLHREQELRDHVAARIREYEAMLTAIGWLTGIVSPPPPMTTAQLQAEVAEAIRELGGTLIENSQREGLDHINPLNAIPTAYGIYQYISGGIYDLIPTETTQEWADQHYARGATALDTDIVSLTANAVNMIINSIVEGLTQYWHDFWREADTNGFLIAYGKLRIDADFLAAELAIDVALGALTGGAGAAVGRVVRVVGRRISSTATEVVIKLGREGSQAIPDTRRVLRIQVNDADIPDNVERLIDEDNLGGAAALDDTAQRLETNPETATTSRIDGDGGGRPPPPTSGRQLTRAERDYLRSRTPSPTIRDMVNDGQPVASPLNPQPDEWVPGLMREERFAADHIVPASRIMDMDGFADLPQSDQIDILNWPDNYHPMSQRANSSRGDKSFEDWTEHIGEGRPVNPELRARMIPREQELNGTIQQRIYDLLQRRQDEGVVELPFRDD